MADTHRRRKRGLAPYQYWCLRVLSQARNPERVTLAELYAEVHKQLKPAMTPWDEEFIESSGGEPRWKILLRAVLYGGRTSLKQNGLIDHVARETFRITDKGRRHLARYVEGPPSWLDPDEIIDDFKDLG